SGSTSRAPTFPRRSLSRASEGARMDGSTRAAHGSSTDPNEEQIRRAADLLHRARFSMALTGAGLSKESGIPTFRGQGGLWTRFGEPPMNGYQIFLQDPAAWWENRQREQSAPTNELAVAIAQAEPNPGHLALAELERLGYLRATVTQNIDNLHRVAGSE